MTARISPRRHGAPLFWLIAIACFLAAAAGIGARVAYRAADTYAEGLRGALTVRIIAPDTDEAVQSAAAALRTAAGIYEARAVTKDEAAQLLESWGGPAVQASELPPLRLIELQVARSQATPQFARRIETVLAQYDFQAEVYGPGQWIENWAHVADRARWAAVGLAGVLALAAVFTALLAGRARAAADRVMIAPLADMGATRGQVSRIFAGRAALEGLLAGATGAIAAFAAAYGAYYFMPDLLPELVPSLNRWIADIEPIDTAPLAATPILASLLTAIGARAGANRAFARAARLS